MSQQASQRFDFRGVVDLTDYDRDYLISKYISIATKKTSVNLDKQVQQELQKSAQYSKFILENPPKHI